MSTVVVRYRTKPDRSDKNQGLIEGVFEELAATNPAGLSYATLRLADGTFIHIADIVGDANPLSEVAAFAEFLSGIEERCEPGQGPDPQQATLVGSYHFSTWASAG
jgi:hypothetical protein